MRDLWIGAQRSSERLGRIIGRASGTDHARWGDASLDPSLESGEDIALRILSGGRAADDPSKPLTRPLCPYPQVAKYRGSGDVNDAANFACVAPSSR